MSGLLRITTKLTDRRPDDDVIGPISIKEPNAQAEADSGAAVRVERFVSHVLHFIRVIE